MDITGYLQNALNAEQQGIPVNCKEVAVTVFNATQGIVKGLEEKIVELTPVETDN